MGSPAVAPKRYPEKPTVLKALMRLVGKEWDTFTGHWVRTGWVAERQRLTAEYQEHWYEQVGMCTLCNIEMRDHPPERVWAADARMCPKQ